MNLGILDRVLRLLVGLGVVLFDYVSSSGWELIFLFLGVWSVTTSAFGFCPFYNLVGIRSCPTRYAPSKAWIHAATASSSASLVSIIPIRIPNGATIMHNRSGGIDCQIGKSFATILFHIQRPPRVSNASIWSHARIIVVSFENISVTISGVGICEPSRTKISMIFGITKMTYGMVNGTIQYRGLLIILWVISCLGMNHIITHNGRINTLEIQNIATSKDTISFTFLVCWHNYHEFNISNASSKTVWFAQ